jgi:hypothetical protein
MENLFDEPYREPKRFGDRYKTKHQGIGNLAIEGLESGMTLDEVASEIGVTKGKIIMALTGARYKCDEVEREYAFRRGLFGRFIQATDAQAAEICGIGVWSMASWRIRQGIPANHTRERERDA